MAKRAFRRPTQLEKNNAGCMWAFISLFDFRHGPPTPKLLSDRQPGSSIQDGSSYSKIKLDSLSSYEGKYDDANNDTITEAEGVDSGIARVKILMENKSFQEHLEKNLSGEGQSAVSNLGHKFPSKKNIQQRSKRSKVTSDAHVNNQTGLRRLDDQQSDSITLTDRSSLNFDLIAFLIDLHADRKPYKEMHVNCDNKNDLSLAMKDIIHKMNDHPDEFDLQIDQKEFVLCKALAVIFEAFDNQKFVGGKFIDKAIQSEEFMDALQILNSNKHVVSKLLEDPNSNFNKLTQDLQKIEVGKLAKVIPENHLEKARQLQEDNASSRKSDELENKEMFPKQNTHSFFWKRDKSKGPKLSKQNENSETLSRIVVLKPGPAARQGHSVRSAPSFSPISHHKVKHEEEGAVVSHFSLREIKRRLKHIIGGSKKEGQIISRDGVLHKIPIGYKVSGKKDKLPATDAVSTSLGSRSPHDTEKSGVVFPVAKGKENVVNPEEGKLNVSKGLHISVIKSTPLIYEEAKKHLTEMLDNGDQTASIPTARVSKSLGRLLSMPEYMLSPRAGRGGEKDIVLPSMATPLLPLQPFNQEDPTNSVSALIRNLEISSCSGEHQNDEVSLLPLETEVTDHHMNEELCIASDLNHEGRVQNAETMGLISKICPDQFDALQEPNNNESDVACDVCNGDGSLEVDSHSLVESERPRSPLKENLGTPENLGTITKPGRSSPVSIIEKFISEDFTSPKFRAVHPIIPTVNSRVNLRTCLEDNQARIKYLEAVLQASGLSTIDFSERWHLADKLLEPSLFDEVEASCFPRLDDPKLLFDCIDEALEEIQEKHFKFTPWVSLLASTVQQAPVGRNLVKEVSRRIERHIPIRLPNTIDDVVTKDLDHGSWMDLQFDVEDIVVEIWDTALEDLVEETIFDMWLGLSDDW